MENSEETREIPLTWRDYVKSAKETASLFKWVVRELSTDACRYWTKRFIVALLFSTAFTAASPWFFGYIFNGLTDRKWRTIIIGFAGIALCFIFDRIASYYRDIAREYIAGMSWGTLDERITELFFEKSMGQHIQESSSLNVANIDKGRGKVIHLHNMMLFDGIPMLLSLLFSYIMIWVFSIVAGAITTFVIAVYLIWMLFLNQKVIEVCFPIDKEFRKLNRYRLERWEKVERVKTCGKELEELPFMSAWFNRAINQDRGFWIWVIKQCSFRGSFNFLGFFMILSYGAWQVYSGNWIIGSLYSLYIWSLRVLENIWRVGDIEHEFNWNMPAVRSMINALSIKPDLVEKDNALGTSNISEIGIEFKDVTHTYPFGSEEDEDNSSKKNGMPVVSKINFTIDPGDKVALIGESGAGKTTIMRLLLRYMDPDHGNIFVNSADLRDVKLKSWMSCIGYIPQQSQIYDGTVRYNLTYGLSPEKREKITDDELWKLMRSLKVDFGSRLVNGLETMVGRNGIKLSGGEAQRLMIAAATIKNPLLLVIDEATSNLDSSTEKAVQAGLAAILESKISALIVAHRLSTIRKLCNKFIVLKNSDEVKNGGSQIEAIAGSFEELYKISPTFKRLADDQDIVI
ncbi:MAG: ABC transporter ATP-binding protein [Parcubacteria group bacterium]|nr:ABC transporter ATP-binding protein [Parcubacteria group bacterium]